MTEIYLLYLKNWRCRNFKLWCSRINIRSAPRIKTLSSFSNKASSIQSFKLNAYKFSSWKPILFLLLLLFSTAAFASTKSLPIPRFASIKSNEVNARNGPSTRSPIEWVFVKKGEPVEIIAEYDQWRQIRDIRGEGGWVHSSVLSGKRFVIINTKNILELLKKPESVASVTVKVSPSLRCQVAKCKSSWCKLKCKGYEGWTLKENLWGVYLEEDF
jgi:SH3-like domain-containing protein